MYTYLQSVVHCRRVRLSGSVSIPVSLDSGSGGVGETDPLVPKVESGVVCTHENVAKDPEWAHRSGHVQTNETTEAFGLITGTFLENVLLRFEDEILASELDCDVRETRDLVAIHCALTFGEGRRSQTFSMPSSISLMLELLWASSLTADAASLQAVHLRALVLVELHRLMSSQISSGVSLLMTLSMISFPFCSMYCWHSEAITPVAPMAFHSVVAYKAYEDRALYRELRRSHLLDLFHGLTRPSQERGPTVSDGLATSFAESLATHLDTIHMELPVGLIRERHVSEISCVLARIRATEMELATHGCSGLTIEPESKNRLLQ